MKNIIFRIIGFTGLSLGLFFIAGLTEIGFEKLGVIAISVMGIILFVFIEEIVKLSPLLLSKRFDPKEYLLVVATVFSLFEYYYGGWQLYEVITLAGVIRLVPHYLYAGLYLWGLRSGSKYTALSLAVAGHLVWNIVVLIKI